MAIHMTQDEKNEFDKLVGLGKKKNFDVLDYLSEIRVNDAYPNLYKKLFEFGADEKWVNRMELLRAIENPNYIEIYKPKKYYIHLFKDKSVGYLNKYEDGLYYLYDKRKDSKSQVKFTRSEINEINKKYGFEIKDSALEEVKDDE